MSEVASAEAPPSAAPAAPPPGQASAPPPPADPNHQPLPTLRQNGPYPTQQTAVGDAEGGQHQPPPPGYPGYPPQYYQHYGYPPPGAFQQPPPPSEGAAAGNAQGGAYPGGYPPAYAFHGQQHYPGQYPYGAAPGAPGQAPPPQAPSADGPPQRPDGKVGEAAAAEGAGGTTSAKEGGNAVSTKTTTKKKNTANGNTVVASTDKNGKSRTETVGSVPASIAALKEGSSAQKEEPIIIDVEPMKQDFYFYAADNKEECLEQARAAVREAISTAPPTNSAIEEDDPYLTMTNLNERLIASWQAQARPVRMQYLSKEEDDRRRFQLDDEVASRHCATLTARSRSPRQGARKFEVDPVKTEQPFPPDSELNKEKEGAAAKKRPAAAASENDGEADAKKSRASSKEAIKIEDVETTATL